ncbi:hypothetical protein SAMN02745753_03329 [Marinomonas polaris DSM 16579]|uniref:Uncharacterized protein n=1 Tax=Marinomonas polaris DSM 16579 TaxID=1122206 RepID=A0A1M5HC99_9GAMM|nr:hypothetical protein [Marinomonas polaris]SHG13432.1 hypothetical protein SAMN02745753_03329 [Marinomonas polaris DSM 16579]
MIIIALLKHFSSCFERYKTRRKLSALSHDLRKDLGIMQDSFEAEVGKGNLFTLIKELSAFLKVEAVKKSRVQGE